MGRPNRSELARSPKTSAPSRQRLLRMHAGVGVTSLLSRRLSLGGPNAPHPLGPQQPCIEQVIQELRVAQSRRCLVALPLPFSHRTTRPGGLATRLENSPLRCERHDDVIARPSFYQLYQRGSPCSINHRSVLKIKTFPTRSPRLPNLQKRGLGVFAPVVP